MNISSLRLSHSTRENFHSCARKLEFTKFHKHYGWDDSIAAACGRALHAGYQTYLITNNKDKAIFAMMEEYPSTLVELQFLPKPLQIRSIEAMYSTLMEMFNHSILATGELAQFDFNHDSNKKTNQSNLRSAIEVPFQINFLNFSLSDTHFIPVYYVGFIDFILYDVLNNEFTVVDIKTHRAQQHDLEPKFKFDEQCLPYALILESILGHPVENLRVIYLSTYIDIEMPVVQEYKYVKTKEEIESWIRGMYLDLQLIKTYYQNSWFPRRGTSCFGFNKPCTHFQYCESRDENTIELMLESHKAKKEEKKIVPWITVNLEIQAT